MRRNLDFESIAFFIFIAAMLILSIRHIEIRTDAEAKADRVKACLNAGNAPACCEARY